MDVTEIRFNKYLGIKKSPDAKYLLMLDQDEKYTNHIGTVHASAQFALAEATSGEYLLRSFPEYAEKIIPVVRRVEIKYGRPASGRLFSQAEVSEDEGGRLIEALDKKGRATVNVSVRICDESGNITLRGDYEWFIQKIE